MRSALEAPPVPPLPSLERTKLTMTDLMKRRAEVSAQIETAELTWMEASEALEGLGG